MNTRSHRAQHAAVRHDAEATYQVSLGRRPTGDEYRLIRKDVAAQRRLEQRAARIAAATDRATLRAQRASA